MHYDDPITFPVGSKQSAIIGDFKCDSDGSVYVLLAEDALAGFKAAALELVALTSTGTVVRYVPQDVPGLRHVSFFAPYFVSDSRVYVLALADRVDPLDTEKTIGRARLIQVFDRSGKLTQSLTLDPELRPVNIAAFETGEIVTISNDKLNQTTRLFVLDPSGKTGEELKLFDNDPGKGIAQAAKGATIYSKADSAAFAAMLSLAHLVPRGENLQMLTTGANLPLLEFNGKGWAHETKLALPSGLLQDSLLPSDDKLLHVTAGSFSLLLPEAPPSANNPQVFTTSEIDVFYPQNGALFRRISLPATPTAPTPVCVNRGTYSFLAPRESDGRLQVIRATPVQ